MRYSSGNVTFEIQDDFRSFAAVHECECVIELLERQHVGDDRSQINPPALHERLRLIPCFEHRATVDAEHSQPLEDDAFGEIEIDAVARNTQQRGGAAVAYHLQTRVDRAATPRHFEQY